MVQVVVRAHNEGATVGQMTHSLLAAGFEPIVAASHCTDDTVEVALAAGGRVILVPGGLGAATVSVLKQFKDTGVVLVDGDLEAVRLGVVSVLSSAAEQGFVGKGVLDTAGRSSSRLPELARETGVRLPAVPVQALTCAYSSYPPGFADRVELDLVPPDRGSDLMLSLLADTAGIETVLVPAGPGAHRRGGGGHIEHLVESNRRTLLAFAEYQKGQPA